MQIISSRRDWIQSFIIGQRWVSRYRRYRGAIYICTSDISFFLQTRLNQLISKIECQHFRSSKACATSGRLTRGGPVINRIEEENRASTTFVHADFSLITSLLWLHIDASKKLFCWVVQTRYIVSSLQELMRPLSSYKMNRFKLSVTESWKGCS